jgi:hypothetical protein
LSPALDFSTTARARPDPLGRGLLAAGVVALGAVLVLGLGVRRDARAARDRADAVDAETAALKRQADGLQRAAPGEGAPVSRALRAAEAPPLAVVDAVTRLLPSDVRFDALTVSYERPEVEVRALVVARSPGAWDALRRRLETAPEIRALRAGAEDRSGPLRTALTFTWDPARR